MRTLIIPLLATLLGVAIFGCSASQRSSDNTDVLFQYSTLACLMEGVYDGEMTLAQLKRHGDFGLGTFNALDGEMVQIDHRIYQIKADGIAYSAQDTTKSPFAMVTFFE